MTDRTIFVVCTDHGSRDTDDRVPWLKITRKHVLATLGDEEKKPKLNLTIKDRQGDFSKVAIHWDVVFNGPAGGIQLTSVEGKLSRLEAIRGLAQVLRHAGGARMDPKSPDGRIDPTRIWVRRPTDRTWHLFSPGSGISSASSLRGYAGGIGQRLPFHLRGGLPVNVFDRHRISLGAPPPGVRDDRQPDMYFFGTWYHRDRRKRTYFQHELERTKNADHGSLHQEESDIPFVVNCEFVDFNLWIKAQAILEQMKRQGVGKLRVPAGPFFAREHLAENQWYMHLFLRLLRS